MGGGGGGGGSGGDVWQRRKRPDENPGGIQNEERMTPSGTDAVAGARTGAADFCDIVDEGSLRSPVPAIVNTLKVGSRLSVAIKKIRGVSILVAKVADNGEAGTIDCFFEGDIITCILSGNVYDAIVVKKHSGLISISIRRRKT